MTEKATRRRYTLEYKQEAVPLVASGQKVIGVDPKRSSSSGVHLWSAPRGENQTALYRRLAVAEEHPTRD